MDLGWRLQTLKKGSMNIKQYISTVKGLIYHLLIAGDTINDKEHMIYVLGG